MVNIFYSRPTKIPLQKKLANGNKNVNLQNKDYHMNKHSLIYRIYDLYADGFRNMTLGKTLWTIIKLLIIFGVLKVFFFPDYLKANAVKGDKADFVATELIERGSGATDD